MKLFNTSASYYSTIECPYHTYATVHSWTLQTDGTTWVVDDSTADDDSDTRPWALSEGSPGCARVQLVYPVVSTNEIPHYYRNNFQGRPIFFSKGGCKCTPLLQ